MHFLCLCWLLTLRGLKDVSLNKNRIFLANVLYIKKMQKEKIKQIDLIENETNHNSTSKNVVLAQNIRLLSEFKKQKLTESKTVSDRFPQMKNIDLDFYEMFFTVSLGSKSSVLFTLYSIRDGKQVKELMKCRLTYNPNNNILYDIDAVDESQNKLVLFGDYIKDKFVFICFEKEAFDAVNALGTKDNLPTDGSSNIKMNDKPDYNNETKETQTNEPLKGHSDDQIPVQKSSPYKVVLIQYYEIIEKEDRDKFRKKKYGETKSSENDTYKGLLHFFIVTFILLFCIVIIILALKSK